PPAAERTGKPPTAPSGTPGFPASPRLRLRSGFRTQSLLDVDSQCGTAGLGLTDCIGQLGRWVLVEQNDDAVLLTLVEHLRRPHHAVSRRGAFVLVDSHFHFAVSFTMSSQC